LQKGQSAPSEAGSKVDFYVSQVWVGKARRGTFPHFIAHLVVIAILVAFPSIILWLPSQMGN
jgi:TRAP-type C4-dicarboxylate transport system permease large subunit